jgi:hypothetical protein
VSIFLFVAVDMDGEEDPTVVLCKDEESVANAHRALVKRLRRKDEAREVAVYAFDPYGGRSVALGVEELGDVVVCKDGSTDQQFRLSDTQGLTLHVYNVRTAEADLDRAQGAGEPAPSNAATPGAPAYVPSGDNRDD